MYYAIKDANNKGVYMLIYAFDIRIIHKQSLS